MDLPITNAQHKQHPEASRALKGRGETPSMVGEGSGGGSDHHSSLLLLVILLVVVGRGPKGGRQTLPVGIPQGTELNSCTCSTHTHRESPS